MDWRNLPSLNALKAFSALADTGSYTHAGSALNVTHAAVMQQVKSLEEHFGLQLVIRTGRAILMTEDGRILADKIKTGFEHILDGVDTLTANELARPVQVTMSPAFAAMWLMPRLADFQTRFPDITLLLNPTGSFVELKPGGMDVAIRYSRTDALAEDADTLLDLDLVVVGAPSLLEAGAISEPADLLHMPWLQELGTQEVSDWFSRRGVPLDRPLMISHMPGNLIMDAVKRGDGITYTVRQWLKDEIQNGDLVEMFGEERGGVFYIHTLPTEKRRAVRTFVNWLKSQAPDQQLNLD